MSEYTTDEVLRMLEEWAKDNKGGPGLRFQGFDGLRGADLSKIDLSNTTIQQKVQEYRQQYRGQDPPWLSRSPSAGAHPGLDLSGARMAGSVLSHAQLQGANLRGAQLQRIDLLGAKLQGAQVCNGNLQLTKLRDAELQGVNFSDADLRGADITNAKLRGADLSAANLRKANLRGARLLGAYLAEAEFQEAKLEEADWSGHKGYFLDERDSQDAETVYRQLKVWYSNAGQHDHSGEFHKHEMRMRRKQVLGKNWSPKRAGREGKQSKWWYAYWRFRMACFGTAEWMSLWVLEATSGYGERPYWVLAWTLGSWLVPALAYFLGQATILGSGYSWAQVWEALYFSGTAMLTFDPNPPPLGSAVAPWAATAALIQGATAYFLLALFLVTFVQKASRQ